MDVVSWVHKLSLHLHSEKCELIYLRNIYIYIYIYIYIGGAREVIVIEGIYRLTQMYIYIYIYICVCVCVCVCVCSNSTVEAEKRHQKDELTEKKWTDLRYFDSIDQGISTTDTCRQNNVFSSEFAGYKEKKRQKIKEKSTVAEICWL